MAVSQSLTLTQSSQSVSGNYSKVRILWKSTQSGASFNNNTKTGYYWIALNGGSETKYSVTTTLPKSSTKTILDKTITVNHKADGKGSIKVRTSIATGISAGTVTKSASLTLTTIPRATTPTVSDSSVDMGDEITISTPRAASSFTHDLAYAFAGSDYVSIAADVGTSYTWTVPDLASKIPSAASGTVTVRCITKSGSTEIGTKTVTFTAKVPSSVVPTVSAVTHSEATSGLAAQFGAYVQNKSKLTVKITGAGAKGSTIDEYQATLNGKTYTAASFTSAVLSSSGTLTLRVRVKDSRGRWSAYKETSITVLAYSTPKIAAFSAYRCDADGNADDEGQYIAVTYQYTVSAVGNKNTASMAIKYKRSDATSYTNLITGTSLAAAATSKPETVVFSTDYQYDIQMTLKDWFGATVTANTLLPTAAVILDIRANGKGIAFGKVSEHDGVEFGWDIVDQIKTFGSMSGAYKTHDGLLLQWGTVTITPTAADMPTTVVVTFPRAYASTPAVFLTPVTSVPQNLAFGIQRAVDIVGDPAKAVGVTLTRNGLTSTGAYWLAIGKEAV